MSADIEHYGYEVIAREAIPAMTAVLVEFVRGRPKSDELTDEESR